MFVVTTSGERVFVFVRSTVATVCGALLATGLGLAVPSGAAAASGLVSQDEMVAGLSEHVGALSGLGALPSDPPAAGFESGGGGLVGEPWPVWGLPGARWADDPGINESELPQASVGSLRPKFTALPGQEAYRFTVADVGGRDVIWDSGEVSASTDDCVITEAEASCTLPAGLVGSLRNRESYRLTTVAGGVTSVRLFEVKVGPGISGSSGLVTLGQQYSTAAGGLMQVGLGYSTADVGPVPQEAGTRGLVGDGLPAGWEWLGPVAGFISIERTMDGAEYSGYKNLVTVKTQSGSQTLGCVDNENADTVVCGAVSGGVLGAGFSAVIYADDSVVVSNDGQSWTFNAADELTAAGTTGLATTTFTHRVVDGAAAPVLSELSVPDLGWQWQLHYSGDAECGDADLPEGFSGAPAGYACGWTEPDGKRSHIFYTQPDGATVPRISRVVHAPAGCGWDACETAQLGVFDLGWDDHNRVQFQRQDGAVEAALIGHFDAGDDQYWASFDYDGLGRLAASEQGVLKPAGSNGDEVGRVRTTYAYQDAEEQYRPAFRQLVTTTHAPGAPQDLSTITAVDEAVRIQFEVAEDGVVDQYVWDADKPLQYGMIAGDETVTGAEYDKHSRAVNEVAGPLVAFDLDRCAPNAPARGNESCQPRPDAPTDTLMTKTTAYDQQASVGTGLRAQWYDNPRLTGHPVAATQLQQGSGADAGFQIDPPQAAGSDWSVAMTGALVLDQQGAWNVTVEAPAGMFSDASVFLGGTVCAVLPAGGTHAACTVTSDDDDDRVPVRLVGSHNPDGPTTGKVVVSLQSGPFDPPTTAAKHFLPLFGAVAHTVGVDHDPNGDPIPAETSYTYEDPNTDLATTTTKTASEQIAVEQAADQHSDGAQTHHTQVAFERTPFGGNRPTTFTHESGSESTQHYWGLDETPKSVGVANLDQIPERYRNVSQLGRAQYVESSGGHQRWAIYDQRGAQACEALVQNGNDPAWSCEERDPRGRLTKAVARGQDGQNDIITEHQYLFDPNPDRSPFITQSTRTEAGKPTLTAITREWASGLSDQYVDVNGATTQIIYEPYGLRKESRTVIDPATARPQTANTSGSTATSSSANDLVTLVTKIDYDSLSRPHTYSDQNGVVAQVRYDTENPRKISGYDYLGGKASMSIDYDQYQRAKGTTWNLPDAKVHNTWTATAAGRLFSEQFADTSNTYDYDRWGRLTQATITTGDADHHFLYGWDVNSQRTCAARETNNHANGDCDTAENATTFTYKNDRLVESSSPTTRIPNDPFNNDGSYKKVGHQTYTYDAARQLVAADSQPDADHQDEVITGQVAYLRDADNRVVTQTMTGENYGAYTNIYAEAGFGAGIVAVVTPTGEVVPTQSLPGGLVRQGDDQLVIGSAGGLTTLTLNPDANLGDTKAQPWGPYGEPITNTTSSTDSTTDRPNVGWHGQNSSFDATLMNLGVRTYRSDLGIFTRPDPIPGGSGTANEYAYVSGDPINSHDLTGTIEQWHTILANIGTLLASAVAFVALFTGIQRLPSVFLNSLKGATRYITHFAANATASIALGIGVQLSMNEGPALSTWQWVTAGLTAAIAGALGAAGTAGWTRAKKLIRARRGEPTTRQTPPPTDRPAPFQTSGVQFYGEVDYRRIAENISRVRGGSVDRWRATRSRVEADLPPGVNPDGDDANRIMSDIYQEALGLRFARGLGP